MGGMGCRQARARIRGVTSGAAMPESMFGQRSAYARKGSSQNEKERILTDISVESEHCGGYPLSGVARSRPRWVHFLADSPAAVGLPPARKGARPHEQPDRPPSDRGSTLRTDRRLRRQRGRDRRALRARRRPIALGFWADQARDSALAHALHRGARLVEPAVREVVRRRRAQRRLQLPRPPCRGRQRRPRRPALGGRARRRAPRHLRRAHRRGQAPRERARGPRHRPRRPRRDLHADDPRGGRLDARGARASARSTPSSSAASRPTASAPASTTPAPSSSSPPTAATARARSRRSSPPSTWRSATAAPACRRPSSTCSSSSAATTTSTGPTAATCGGTTSCRRRPPSTRRRPFPAENPLFILYTSGTTGKPKGILHTSGGYLTQAAFTNKVVHDIHPETDVYWCTADIGWVTGHTYVTYGPLANGATQVLYEGTPDTPAPRPLVGDRARSTASRCSTRRRPRSARS